MWVKNTSSSFFFLFFNHFFQFLFFFFFPDIDFTNVFIFIINQWNEQRIQFLFCCTIRNMKTLQAYSYNVFLLDFFPPTKTLNVYYTNCRIIYINITIKAQAYSWAYYYIVLHCSKLDNSLAIKGLLYESYLFFINW